MGYELYREVKVWAPDGLTHREKLTALVLADDANDVSRLTFHSVVDPEIMRQSLVKNQRDMLKIVARLQDQKVIEHAGGGHNGRIAKYRFLQLAPDVGPMKPGENQPVAEAKGVQNDPATAPSSPAESDTQRPARRSEADQNEHPSADEGCSNQPRRVSRTNTPTPPYSSTTPSSSVAEAVGLAEAPSPGEGEEEQQTDTITPEAFLQALPAPWGVGGPTARGLAPLLAKAAAERHWRLDAALVAELTKNPDGIRQHSSVLRRRIEDLPYRERPIAKPKRTCRDCGEPHPNVADNGLCPPCIRGDTSSQHRHGMPADFRQLLRQARERTSS